MPFFYVLSSFTVCLEVSVFTSERLLKLLRWSLGPCKSKDDGYYSDGSKVSLHKCCLEVGEHKLTCESTSDPAVWAKSDGLMIQGHKYCTYFVGRRARQIIYISGK